MTDGTLNVQATACLHSVPQRPTRTTYAHASHKKEFSAKIKV